MLYRLLAYYTICCLTLGIGPGEIAFHPARWPIEEDPSTVRMAVQVGAELQNASLTAGDGVQLRGWFVHPSESNHNAVILLHGIGANREDMWSRQRRWRRRIRAARSRLAWFA